VVRAESPGSALLLDALIGRGDSVCIGDKQFPRPFTEPAMLTLRTSSPFELFDRLEQQLSQQLQSAERVPAAEVVETADAYEVVVELPGVDKASIAVKATERTLVITAERRSRQPSASADQSAQPSAAGERAAVSPPLISEFRYGTWSRSFRFPVAIEREQLEAHYRDGLLHVKAPKANTLTTVTVKVDG
jgi:HSP20 family protein